MHPSGSTTMAFSSKYSFIITDLKGAVPATAEEVTQAHIEEYDVNSIDLLTEFPNLEDLVIFDTTLDNHHISTISKLKGLKKLVFWDSGPISDLTFLKGLTSLTSLNISDSFVTDISILSTLTELEELFLDGTDVVDLSPLEALPLKTLHLPSKVVSGLETLPSQAELVVPINVEYILDGVLHKTVLKRSEYSRDGLLSELRTGQF